MHIQNQPRAHLQFETKNGELIITPLAKATFSRSSDGNRFYVYLEQMARTVEIESKEFHEIMKSMGMKPV